MAHTSSWDRLFDQQPTQPPSSAPGQPAPAGHRSSRRRKGSRGKRLDIQGLRALAVLAVILNHLTGVVSGGFVGVDVFFVISGFLITSHLVSDTSRRGHVSFTGFYSARMRRILPAALVTLAASWIAASLVFKGARVASIHNDILWALGFAANIHFAHTGTDYFQANQPVSLVQQYWSLSVEEQFYVVWPIVIAIVMFLLGRHGHLVRFRSALFTTVAVAVVASFVWGLHESAVHPTSAYFSTLVRAWELGIGAALAVAVIRFPDAIARLRRVSGPAAFAGLALIVASAFVVPSAPGFPAPWAALPVLATGLVILAGSAGRTGLWTAPLHNRAAVYLGDISYSLYLWHFPVILVVAALVPDPAWVRYPVTICAIAALSVFSYRFIEQPFRLKRDAEVPDRQSRLIPLLATAGFTVVGLAIYAERPVPTIPDLGLTGSTNTTAVSSPKKPDPSVAVPTAAFAREIRAAVEATSWPKLTPSLDQLDLSTARAVWGPCFDVPEDSKACRFSTSATDRPGKVAVVLGDSIAASWLAAVRAVLVPRGWTVYGITHGLCPAALVSVDAAPKNPSTAGNCDNDHSWMVSRTLSFKPSLVIMSQALNTLYRMRSNASGAAAAAEYQGGLERAERALQGRGRTVLTLTPPPRGKGLTSCDTAGSVPASCVTTISSDWTMMATAERQAARATRTLAIDDSQWFCYRGYCPPFVGSTAVFYDQEHITEQYAKLIAPQMALLFKQKKILTG